MSPRPCDPVRDIEVINTELILADLDSVQRRRERVAKDAKRGDKVAAAEEAVLAALETALDSAASRHLPSRSVDDERAFSRPLFLLTDKPTIFACNVKESDLADGGHQPLRRQGPRVRRHALELRSGRHQRADRKRPGGPVARRGRCLSS